jgi:Cu(I)/Ag(I) efflux system membrane fusion protein
MADATALRQAAAQKLNLWGVTPAQLDAMAMYFDKTGDIPDHVTVLATAGGIVTRKEIRQGGYLQSGDIPFTVADLSSVWLTAKIYESDVALVKVGQMAQVIATGAPGRAFAGKVTFMAFQLDPATRTLDARVEIPNSDMALRPGMFATATISPEAKRMLALPRSAVIDTGAAKVVYVRSGEGIFDMHEVKVGPEAGDEYPVISGLKEGDQVVTRGTFLVDAENRLNPPNDSAQPAAKPNMPGDMPANMQMP